MWINGVLGERYREVYYLGKKWLRVEMKPYNFWSAKPGGWTNVVYSPFDRSVYSVVCVFRR